MNPRSSKIILFTWWVGLLSCRPQEPLPVNMWSQGCIQLSPDSIGFRLSGMCCEYIVLPPLSFDSNHQFSVKAEYFTFTGAGFAGQPIHVNGELSGDSQTLTIHYPTGTTLTTYELKQGAATTVCHCGCD